jgi:hypothetical protein
MEKMAVSNVCFNKQFVCAPMDAMPLHHCVCFHVRPLGFLGAAYFASDLFLGEIVWLFVAGLQEKNKQQH